MSLYAISSSDFPICYKSRSRTVKFGFISKFLKIETKIYAFIQIVYKKLSLKNDNELNEIPDNCFLIGRLSNKYEIINLNQILTKSSIFFIFILFYFNSIKPITPQR